MAELVAAAMESQTSRKEEMEFAKTCMWALEKEHPQVFQATSKASSLDMSDMTDGAHTSQGVQRVMDQEQALGSAARSRESTSQEATEKAVVTPSSSTLKFWAAQWPQLQQEE